MSGVGQGFKSWASVDEESVWSFDPGGTADAHIRLVSESMGSDEQYLDAPGMGDRHIDNMFKGPKIVGGDLTCEMSYEGGAMYLLKHAMGKYTYTNDAPVVNADTHLFETSTKGPPNEAGSVEGLTIEVSKGDIEADEVFLYTGCLVDSATINFATGEIMSLAASIVAKEEAPGTARKGAPSFTTAPKIKYHHSGALTLAGVGSVPVKSGSITIRNNLGRRFLMDRLTARPCAESRRIVEGTIVAEFDSLDEVNAIKDFTTGNFTLNFASTEFVTGSTPYQLNMVSGGSAVSVMTGATPTVGGEGHIEIPISFRIYGSANELDITVINGENTYGPAIA